MEKNKKSIKIISGVDFDEYEKLKDKYDHIFREYISTLHEFNLVENERDALEIEVESYKKLLKNPNKLLETIKLKDIENYLRNKKLEKLD